MIDQTKDTDSLLIKAINEEWGLIRSRTNAEDLKNPQYYLVWLAEEEPFPNVKKACERLASQPALTPGVHLSFVEKPALGMIIRPKPGWNLEEGDAIGHFFDKLVWELNRLQRSIKS